MSIRIIFLLSIVLLLSGCVPAPPRQQDNVCHIFRQYPNWYWEAQEASKKYGVRISLIMAVMHQESRFNGTARPPREKLLGFIPWFRPTSSYGYSQAKDGTWAGYQKDTGAHGADRDAFGDAADFIAWYAYKASQRLHIWRNNTYDIYLAYHEGMGGYERKTYLRKRWLIAVAKKVAARGWRYHQQLLACRASLPKKPWWRAW